MEIKSATFITSSPTFEKCPPPEKPEYAFIGRSNVGKSSLINMLCNLKGLAKTSGKPGKTQLINHFLINENWYLVDLPGYGFAKISKKVKDSWEGMIKTYVEKRPNLMYVMLLIDSRLEPQKNDLDFMAWLAKARMPFVIIFTKVDKLTSNKTNSNIASYKKKLLESWEELPPIIISSSETTKGKQELLNFIEESNEYYVSTKRK